MQVVLGLDKPDPGTATAGGRPYRALKHPLTRLGPLLDAAALQPNRSQLWLGLLPAAERQPGR